MELDFKTLYHHAPCGYLYTMEDGTLIHVNDTFLEFTGYSRKEIIENKRFEDFLSIGGKIYYETHFAPLLNMHGEVSQINFDFIRKDETRLPVLINAIKQSADEKQHNYIQFIVLDITQRKEYETELMNAKKKSEELLTQLAKVNKELIFQNQEKEKQASELAIANIELAFQNEEKEKRASELGIANTQLIDFCNIVSHNLRAPLVNISLLVDYIEFSKDEEESKEMFGKIKTVISHLNEVFNELVESLQVRQDREVKTENIILKDCLESVLIGFESQIKLYNADIQINFNDIFEISFPQQYLDSIFTNLISNALRYKSSDRNPVIKIITEKINGDIVLSIADNGLGIDLARNKDKLFKIRKTFHAHPDAKGFGLFITKTQVEAMGGKIWAESVLDKGSTFFIKFKS